MNTKIHSRKQKVLDIFGKDPEDLDELAECVITVINKQTDNSVIGFCWCINFDEVRNTHNCPANGKTNWGGRNPRVPTSYPGWSGRVWIRYNKAISGSEPFYSTLTYPGTGGFGGYSGPWERVSSEYFKMHGHKISKDYPRPQIFSWDYSIFLDDWPCIYNNIEAQHIINKLAGTKMSANHKYMWNDAATIKSDAIIHKTYTNYTAKVKA